VSLQYRKRKLRHSLRRPTVETLLYKNIGHTTEQDKATLLFPLIFLLFGLPAETGFFLEAGALFGHCFEILVHRGCAPLRPGPRVERCGTRRVARRL
jgi:hypothetical protein